MGRFMTNNLVLLILCLGLSISARATPLPFVVQAGSELADGMVAAGVSASEQPLQPHIGLVKMHADGSFDTAFGQEGVAFLTNLWGAWSLQVTAVGKAEGGKVLVAGRANDTDTFVARVLPDGTPDFSFGIGGFILDTTTPGLRIHAVAAASGYADHVLVAGAYKEPLSGTRWDVAMVRYTSWGGMRDPSFGQAGMVVAPMSAGDNEAYGMGMDHLGRIVLVGYNTALSHTATNAIIARFHADGTSDLLFGTDGRIEYGAAFFIDDRSSWARVVAFDASGALAVGGSYGHNIGSLRQNHPLLLQVTESGTIQRQVFLTHLTDNNNFECIFCYDAEVTSLALITDSLQFATSSAFYQHDVGDWMVGITARQIHTNQSSWAFAFVRRDDTTPWKMVVPAPGVDAILYGVSYLGAGHFAAMGAHRDSTSTSLWRSRYDLHSPTWMSGENPQRGLESDFEGTTGDAMPDAIAFAPQTNVSPAYSIFMGCETVAGLDVATSITMEHGTFDTASYPAGNEIRNGQWLCDWVDAGLQYATTYLATLHIGEQLIPLSVTTAPPLETTITSAPPVVTTSDSASFLFAANGSLARFEIRLDGGVWQAMGWNTVTYSGLAEGQHVFAVRAVDSIGPDATPASHTWTVDQTAPTTTITSGPNNIIAQSSATIAFTSNEAGVVFACSLDGAPFAACTSPASLTALNDGSHTYQVRATDAAGHREVVPASRTWTVDTTAPQTALTSGPTGSTATTSAAFQFNADDTSAMFECRLDGAAFVPCTSPASYSALASGVHTFAVRAKDSLGNTDSTPATRTWTVDTVVPETTITNGPSGNVSSTTATLTFTSNETGATFECRLNSGAYAPCISPTSYTSLAKGTHVFYVRARDAAGNVDASPASRSWRIR